MISCLVKAIPECNSWMSRIPAFLYLHNWCSGLLPLHPHRIRLVLVSYWQGQVNSRIWMSAQEESPGQRHNCTHRWCTEYYTTKQTALALSTQAILRRVSASGRSQEIQNDTNRLFKQCGTVKAINRSFQIYIHWISIIFRKYFIWKFKNIL